MKTKLIWAALCVAFALLACRQQKDATASHPRQVEGVTFSTIQNKEGNSHFEIEVCPAAGLPAEDTLAKSAEVRELEAWLGVKLQPVDSIPAHIQPLSYDTLKMLMEKHPEGFRKMLQNAFDSATIKVEVVPIEHD